MAKSVSREELLKTLEAIRDCGGVQQAAKALGVPRGTVLSRREAARKMGLRLEPASTAQTTGEAVKVEGESDGCVLTLRSKTVRTLEGALAEGHVDTDEWEVERWVLNKWDVAASIAKSDGKGGHNEELTATELWQVKVWFKKRKPVERSLLGILDLIRENSPVALSVKRPAPPKGSPRRTLEISIMDPHLGLHCFPPAADKAWSLEDCEQVAMWALDGLIAAAASYFPVEQIVFPFGNDFLHADNLWHETTGGTPQPEMDAWHETYMRGERLAIAMVDRMKEIAPVQIYSIPGNHDRQSAFTLGRLLNAYYHRDQNVAVDASPSPYKFHHYGVNLIGFEHGHSVPTIRLAALMANEAPEAWAATKGGYREWHLGDQHRKGSGKPSVMEEQGVSVEFLPGLTPPNEWHRLKAYNWQKRGAMAWVWDYDLGPIARLQVNLNSFTGKPTGIGRKDPR